MCALGCGLTISAIDRPQIDTILAVGEGGIVHLSYPETSGLLHYVRNDDSNTTAALIASVRKDVMVRIVENISFGGA